MTLSRAARYRGLILLIVINFMMYAGFFMVIPLVSVHYVQTLGFAAVTVGIALALRQLVQQGVSVGGGVLSDRFGGRSLITAGVLVRAAGFASLAFANTPPFLFFAMLLSALGGALFEAPSRAGIATLTTEDERARAFSINGVGGGLGMVIGPFTGSLLLEFGFSTVALAAAACFALIGAMSLLLPPIETATDRSRLGFGLRLALHDRPFLIFTALLMGFWYMWVQLTISLPLAGERLANAADAVRWIYGVNAGMTVILQLPLIGFLERWLRPLSILILGIALMALGLGMVALADSFPRLIGCVIVFTLGTLLATPSQQSVTAALADPRALGSYFGVNALALAVGGGLGNLSGGLLIDLANALQAPALPWIAFACIGLASAIGLMILGNYLQQRRATAHLVGVQQR
ncbi:MFS transporter [uncultured Chloroflexus sp.]|uniref:MFS transporter n=1 Tax=uncultured Chloroflexus sp. TaxID=214040 RepID=UPI002610DBF3|nr:MFS transporter [uncultured Chloroflexus sp.]